MCVCFSVTSWWLLVSASVSQSATEEAQTGEQRAAGAASVSGIRNSAAVDGVNGAVCVCVCVSGDEWPRAAGRFGGRCL